MCANFDITFLRGTNAKLSSLIEGIHLLSWMPSSSVVEVGAAKSNVMFPRRQEILYSEALLQSNDAVELINIKSAFLLVRIRLRQSSL